MEGHRTGQKSGWKKFRKQNVLEQTGGREKNRIMLWLCEMEGFGTNKEGEGWRTFLGGMRGNVGEQKRRRRFWNKPPLPKGINKACTPPTIDKQLREVTSSKSVSLKQ